MTALERLIGDYQNLRNGECEANTADRDADIAAVRAEHAELVAALRDCQWCGSGFEDDPHICCDCGRTRREGHSTDCQLAAVLAKHQPAVAKAGRDAS